MSEFERAKQDIDGRSILITSWYDDHTQTWRASAPAYSYISALAPAVPAEYGSRKEAVQHLTNLLVTHFSRK